PRPGAIATAAAPTPPNTAACRSRSTSAAASALAADLAGRTAAEIQRRDEAEAGPGRGVPTRGDWRLARDRTRAAEHEAERLEAEVEHLRAGLREGREAVDEASVCVLRANAEVNEARAAMQRQAAELLEARAEVERLRAGLVEQVATVEIAPDPSRLLAALRATADSLAASRAPESPADAPDPSNDPPSG
ncbi:hypothetical protein ACWDT6_30215, partial [Nocardia grenadensis]